MTVRDRRRAARLRPSGNEPIARLRLRAGREVSLVDVSSCGALVEGEARLLPGTHVDVHVTTTQGRVLVRSRIVRAYIAEISRERVTYRSALSFERHIEIGGRDGYSVPVADESIDREAGISYPGRSA